MNEDQIKYMVELCQVNAKRSKDPSTKVGAVIYRPDFTIASMGRNGFPIGANDDASCYADREYKYRHILHAELNCLLFAREPLHGYGLCVWPLPPCERCMAAILQAGIRHVVSPVLDQVDPRWHKTGYDAKVKALEHGVTYHEYRKEQL